MKIWIVAEGEPLPCVENARLMRMGILAEYLDGHGHDVSLWASTFIHGTKKYYCKEYKKIGFGEKGTLHLLHSPISYRKNTSVRRILYHEILGRAFYNRCREQEKPDVILCSYPTEQFARYVNRYAHGNDIPVILDARDLWPDIFTRAFPEKLQRLAKIGLYPLERMAKSAFRKSDVIIGVVPSITSWGLEKAGRNRRKLDQTIYIGYRNSLVSQEEMDKEKIRWNSLGVSETTWNLCFVGTLSNNSLDMSTAIKAVLRLEDKYPDIRLVICGDGDGMKEYKRLAGNSTSVVFGGWSNNSQIQRVLSMGNAGLYCYKNLEDFKEAFGNKIIAYMAAGLPVLSSLEGFSKKYINKYKIGELYSEGDVDSCEKQIEYMYLHDDEMMQKGICAKERYEIDFDAEVVNKQFEQLLLDTIRQGKKGNKL